MMRAAMRLTVVAAVCAAAPFARAEKMSSPKYAMVFSESAASLNPQTVSAKYQALYLLLGSTSPEYTTVMTGTAATVDVMKPYFEDVLGDWQFYQLAEIRARENRVGPEILPQTWTKDDDPYFFWILASKNKGNVSGYSYDVDKEPDESVDTYEPYVQYDDGAFPEGVHTFYARARTVRGNWGPSVSFAVWVDASAPTASGETPLAGSLVREATIAVSCQLFDAYSGIDETSVTMSVNGTDAAASYDAATQTLALDEAVLESGENVVEVRFKDVVGNDATKTWSFVLDNEAPTGSVSINNGDTTTDNAFVTLKTPASDAVSSVSKMYIAADGMVDAEFAKPLPYAPLTEDVRLAQPETPGLKTVAVVFEDAAGNRSPQYTATVMLTSGAPDTKIFAAPDTVTPDASATFAYGSSRTDAVFCHSLDDGAYAQWSTVSEVTFSDLPAGSHLFKVRSAVDLDGDGTYGPGEIDPSPAQWVWSVTAAASDEGSAAKTKKTLYYRRN